MTLVAISKQKHSSYRYKNPQQFFLYKEKGLIPFCVAELHKIITNYTIVFTRNKDDVSVSFMSSFSPNNNLLIDENGKWLGNYMPAIFRSLPFVYINERKVEKNVLGKLF